MDPFTISTGVLACISISIKVLVGLKQLKANVGGGTIGDASIDVLAGEIAGLRQALQSMEDAFQDLDDDQALRETGHAGTHWRNLCRCLNDEHAVLSDFDDMLFDLIKKVKVLAPSRMKSRLQSAGARFVLVGQQVQAYKDAFTVSLDILILSKTVSEPKPTAKVDSAAMKQTIQRSVANVEGKMKVLERVVAESDETKTVEAVAKLKQCVASAASLFFSASASTPAEKQRTHEESLQRGSHDGVMKWMSSVDDGRLQTPPAEDSGFESASPQRTATQPPTRKTALPTESPSAPTTPAASSSTPATSPAHTPGSPPRHGHTAHSCPPHPLSPHQHPGQGPVIMYMSPVNWHEQKNSTNTPVSPIFPVQVIYGPPPPSTHPQAPFQQPVMPFKSLSPPSPTAQPSKGANDAKPSLRSPNPQSQPQQKAQEERQLERQPERRPDRRPEQQPAQRSRREPEEQPQPQRRLQLQRQHEEQSDLQPPPKVQPKLQSRTEQLPLPRSQVRSLPTSLSRPQPSYGNSDEGFDRGSTAKHRLTKLQKPPRLTGKTVQAEKGGRASPVGLHDTKSRLSTVQPIPTKRKSQNPFTGLRRLMPGSGEHLPRRQKLCFVGDSGCGKTCLLTGTTKGTFPEAYEPTTFENYISGVDVKGVGRLELEVWDTAGQEIYDNLRALSYPDSQALILCFSIGDPLSYHNLLERWLPEATRFCPDTPIFVIGCKQDLRFDHKTIAELQRSGQLPLTTAEGLAAAGRLGARYYVETSAKSSYGVDNLLATIAEEIQKTAHTEPITNLARRFHEDVRVINEERRNLRATGEILTPREKEYASRYVRVMDQPNSTMWKLQEERILDKSANGSRSSFFRKSS